MGKELAIFNNQQYISILNTGISSGGGLAVTINDKTFQNSLTYAVSGLTGLEDPQTVAYKTAVQLTTWLIQTGYAFTTDYSLTGVPYYCDLPQVQQYNVTLTDHCVCVWSQSMFVLSASSTMGNLIHTTNIPILMTIDDLDSMAGITGLDLTDLNGVDLTVRQKGDLLKLVSAKLIGFTNNRIVLSTYIQEESTSWVYGIFLKKTPVADFVPPQVRQPVAFNLFSAITYSTVKSNYMLEPDTGYFGYRFAQNIVDYVEPFQWGNDVLITYIAGFPYIPEDIDNAIISLIPIVQAQTPIGVKAYKGGTFDVQFGDVNSAYNLIMANLRAYYQS